MPIFLCIIDTYNIESGSSLTKINVYLLCMFILVSLNNAYLCLDKMIVMHLYIKRTSGQYHTKWI